MNRFSFSPILAACLLLFFCVSASSQSPDDVHVTPRAQSAKPQLPEDGIEVRLKPLRVDINLVLVPVNVMDASGSPVMDLDRTDFHLYEKETEQQIRYFYSEDAPISIGLVLDLSSSMNNKIDRVRQAVDEFFKNADSRDDYFVITFANKPKLFADTTQSTGTIQARLADMKPRGNTALADAIYMGITKLRSATYQRRALLIVSDGGDNMSRHSLRQVKKMAKEADAQIYAINICDAPSILFTKKLEERFGRQWLTQVTEQTGGRTISLDDANNIPAAASQISIELRNQYVLGYRPSDIANDGKWRKIKVKVARAIDPAPLQVYHRSGYMARKLEDEQK